MEPKPLTDAEMDALSAQTQAQPVQKAQPVKMSVPNRPLSDAEMDAMTAQPAQVQAPKKQGVLSAIAQPFKTFLKGTQGAGEVQNQVTGLAEKQQVKSIDEQNRLYAQSKTLPVGSPERRALIQQAGGLAQQEGMVADKSMKTLAEAPQAHQMIGATAEIASYGIGGGAALKTAGTGILAGIAQGAKAGLLEGAFGGAVQGVGQAMQEDTPTFGSMVKGGLVGGALGGVLGTGLGAGVGALRAAPRMAESGAGRIMNSLIKPLSKDFAYGKNPGAGVANEGIIANSAEELGEKVFQKRQELGSNIGRLLDETPIPPQSIDDTVAIIDGELDSLRRNPQTNSAIINRLEGFKSDFLKLHTGQAPRTQGLSGQDIFNLKSELGDLTKWTGNASDDKIYNKTLKRMYGSLREKLENNIPGLSDLNERFANLTSAKNAIEHRSIIEARQNLVNLPGKIGLGVSGVLGATLNPVAIPAAILSIGIDNALSSTAFKTRFAQALMKMAPDKVAEFIESSPLIKRFIGALEKQGDLPPEVSQKIQVYGRNIEQSVPVKNIRQMDVNRPGVLPQQVKLGEPKKPAPVNRKIPVVDESEMVQTMDINRPGVSSQQVKLGEMRKPAPVRRTIPVTEDDGVQVAPVKSYGGYKEPSLGVSTETNPILQEARKYKTAEEFVRAQSNVSHGGNLVGEIDTTKGSRNYYGKGFYVTDKQDIAGKYGNVNDLSLDTSKIVERKAPMNEQFANKIDDTFDFPPKIYTYADAYDFLTKKLGSEQKASEFFAKNGIDGWSVKSPTSISDDSTSYTIFNKDSVQTKSQLTSLWEQAQKEKGSMPVGATSKLAGVSAVASGIGGLSKTSNTTEYVRPEEPKEQQVQRQEQDFSNIKPLKLGKYEYRPKPVPANLSSIGAIEKEYGLPSGYLKALVMMESHMGEKKAEHAKGKFGYLVGFMGSAEREMKRLKKQFDLDTEEGALRAAAEYTKIRSKAKGVSDPVDMYNRAYETSNDPTIRKVFKYYLDAYKD